MINVELITSTDKTYFTMQLNATIERCEDMYDIDVQYSPLYDTEKQTTFYTALVIMRRK